MKEPDKKELILDFLKSIDAAWSFKRIVVPEHLLKKWNTENKGKSNRELVNVAFTVSKDFEVNEDSIWGLLNEGPRIVSSRISNPPKTGMKKRSLLSGLES